MSSRLHRYVCAYAALTASKEDNIKGPRQTLVVLDLNKVALPARTLSP